MTLSAFDKLKFLFICMLHMTVAYSQTIKVAIVDDLVPKWASETYQMYYLNGIQVATDQAQKVDIKYQIKTFFYSDPAVNILGTINSVKNWQPDIVIGPRFSEHFLLLKSLFNNVLVLSPYATANDLYALPSNFYTLAIPADYSANKMVKYIKLKQKPRTVFIFTDITCKACGDLRNSLNKYLKLNHYSTQTIDFIDDNIINHQLNYLKIFNNYKDGDIIILNTTGYSAGILISEISNSIKRNNIRYLGGDGWGTFKDWDVAKIKTPYTYRAYRVTPKSININDPEVNNFSILYKKKFDEYPDAISYIAFNALNSVTDALAKYNCSIIIARDNILCSYRKAITLNLQWHRPVIHEVYEVKKSNESFIMDIL